LNLTYIVLWASTWRIDWEINIITPELHIRILYLGRFLDMDWLINWFTYCCTSRSRIFHLYEDVTIVGEGLQNLGLCSTLRVFEQGGIFSVLHLLWHGASVFPVSSEGPPQFCSPSLAIVISLYTWNILKRDVKQQITNHQTSNIHL
jgi:hypothetical protein